MRVTYVPSSAGNWRRMMTPSKSLSVDSLQLVINSCRKSSFMFFVPLFVYSRNVSSALRYAALQRCKNTLASIASCLADRTEWPQDGLPQHYSPWAAGPATYTTFTQRSCLDKHVAAAAAAATSMMSVIYFLLLPLDAAFVCTFYCILSCTHALHAGTSLN